MYTNSNQKYCLVILIALAAVISAGCNNAPAVQITINNNAQYANSRTVQLHVFMPDSEKFIQDNRSLILKIYKTTNKSSFVSMCFSENGSSFSSPIPYAEYYSYTLSAGDGTRKIYVKAKDSQGLWSSVASDTIILDTTRPQISINRQPSATYTNQNVYLNPSATDNITPAASIVLSGDSSPYAQQGVYSNIVISARDAAANTATYNVPSFTIDKTVPQGSVSINNGAQSTDSTQVTLTLSATDALSGVESMCFSTNGTTYSSAEAFASQRIFTLPTGSGLKRVYVKYKDRAGNWSAVYNDSITLNMSPALESEEDAYEFLLDQMDKYISADTARLVENYSFPYPFGPYDAYTSRSDLCKLAFVYDNSLAAIAFVLKGKEGGDHADDYTLRAKRICQALVWHFNHDPSGQKRLRDVYYAHQDLRTASTSQVPSDISFSQSGLGALSWAIIALSRYYTDAQDSDQAAKNQFLQAATEIGDFLHAKLYDSSHVGYRHSIDKYNNVAYYKSVEQNTDAYIAFARLYLITNNIKWKDRANNTKQYIDACWDTTAKRYFCGSDDSNYVNRYNLVEDANAYPVLAFGPLTERYKGVDWVYNNLRATDDNFEGFDYGINTDPSAGNWYSPEPDGVWFEGTANIACAYQVMGHYGLTNRSAHFLDVLRTAQSTALHSDGYSLVAASRDGVTTGFTNFSYFASPHIASTSWYIFALKKYNPFWGISTEENIPSL